MEQSYTYIIYHIYEQNQQHYNKEKPKNKRNQKKNWSDKQQPKIKTEKNAI